MCDCLIEESQAETIFIAGTLSRIVNLVLCNTRVIVCHCPCPNNNDCNNNNNNNNNNWLMTVQTEFGKFLCIKNNLAILQGLQQVRSDSKRNVKPIPDGAAPSSLAVIPAEFQCF